MHLSTLLRLKEELKHKDTCVSKSLKKASLSFSRDVAVFITIRAPAGLRQKNFNGVYLSHSSEMGTESLRGWIYWLDLFSPDCVFLGLHPS